MKTSTGKSKTKQVSFANNVKGSTEPVKHLSDMTAFERIAYVQTLNFEKEAQKAAQEVDEDFEDGKLTKQVMKRYVTIHFRHFKYQLKLDPTRRGYEPLQTKALKEEVTSRHPDLMRVVQCLERGANPNAIVDKGQSKPLHAVIRRGDARLVDFLLQAGADVNGVDARNQTPLAKACDSQRVDRGYLSMVEVLLAHPDVSKGLEYRDAGSNTALLNAIFRSNVWLTRLLLLKKANVTTGKRNACDVATFILATHLGLELEDIPDWLLHPHRTSCCYKNFSLRGRYHSWREVFWQSLFNSDIELVFRMVQFRQEELEEDQVAGKAKGEKAEEPVKPVMDVSIGGSAEAKKVRRLEREMRKKRTRQERREQEQRENWERQKAAMVQKVDDDFSIKVYTNPKQQWRKGDDGSGAGGIGGGAGTGVGGGNTWAASQTSSAGPSHVSDGEMYFATGQGRNSKEPSSSASSKMQYGSSGSLASDIVITGKGGKNKLQHSSTSNDVFSPSVAKRWTVQSVVEERQTLYSTNPAPGTSLVSFQGPRAGGLRESKSAGATPTGRML